MTTIFQAESCRHPERQAGVDGSEPAADCGAENESDTKCGPKNAKGVRPLSRRGYVADVGVGGGQARGGESGEPRTGEKKSCMSAQMVTK